MTHPRRALLAVPIAVLVASCNPGSPAPYGTVTHPGGSELVVRIEWTGGFVPYEFTFTQQPLFTLLGDGRVIIQGPQVAIYPGPALPNLQVRRLTEEGIQSILFRMAETGLFDESHTYDAATRFIADANSTVFRMNADEREVVVDVYALGLVTDPNSAPAGIPADELEAQARLTSLQDDLLNLDGWVQADDWADTEWQSFQPDALRLLVANIDGEPPNPDGLDADPLPWPVATDADAFGSPTAVQDFRCGVVTGEEAAAWYAALSQANQLTSWSHDGHLYRVSPRPMLPDEALECPATEA